MSDRGVSVIVVNYNCLSTLNACIGTILESKYVEELLLIDNASTDGSIESIKHYLDDRLKIICLSRNVGLTSARNLAATQASCSILAITDADIAVDPQWLEYPCSLLELHKEFGAVQCNLILSEDINKIASLLIENNPSILSDSSIEESNSFYQCLFPVGAAFVIKKDIWKHIGGFDSSLFIGNDDVDFGIRLWLSGYAVVASCKGTVYHKFGTLRSKKHISPIFQFYALRNMFIIWTKNLKSRTIMKHVLPFLLIFPVMTVRYGGIMGVKGMISFLKNLRVVLTKRYEVQSLRRFPDAKIIPMMHQNGTLPIELLTNDFRLIFTHISRNIIQKTKNRQ